VAQPLPTEGQTPLRALASRESVTPYEPKSQIINDKSKIINMWVDSVPVGCANKKQPPCRITFLQHKYRKIKKIALSPKKEMGLLVGGDNLANLESARAWRRHCA
jgi:hypothetical protein